MWDIKLSAQAHKQLLRLNKQDSARIVKKLYFFAKQKDPLFHAKKLKDPAIGQYRFRVGDYRIIFDVDKQGNISILVVLLIKHRKDIYKNL